MKKCTLIGLMIIGIMPAFAQPRLQTLRFDQPDSFTLTGIGLQDKKEIKTPYGIPLFSLLIDKNFYNSYCAKATFGKETITFTLADSVQGELIPDKKFKPGLKYTLRFTNNGKGNHRIENLVPLGEGPDKVYITADGTLDWPQYLCRSRLYRPGYGPVGVVLPDNAWHLGFADFPLTDNLSLTGLARRNQRDKEKSEIDRWAVTLKPGGWVEYNLWFDLHAGEWQEGLKMFFRDRWLYDLPSFNDSMFRRSDLNWMRSKYIMLLQFAWDTKYYDYASRKYNFYENFGEFDDLTGGYDIFTLWPTWPRLGLDQRNQWDMYRDLPGGLAVLVAPASAPLTERQVSAARNRSSRATIQFVR